ncbi:endonuclease/exonuclease/phosphatase family protein [Dyadobacter sp. CY312]|uniref:endonuclease/exonuclease/phosphatase family protein n=1 Tax=Dyadobacter sp. CY312 TaxID=2907303 RepID=UPI001F1E58C7|nr:endonuclease/exonuclease/phosphatase family protein [Dyadobacter sp. CY312]MCE7040527.1 endonuclease/exonuclease/phosphatase family protein [Dyadobacter sp. CY312]
MHSFKLFLEITGGIIVLFSVIPLVKNDYWVFRVFEYPRLQKLFLNLVIFIVYTFYFGNSTGYEIFIILLIAANSAYLIYQIFPFTFFAKKVLLNQTKTDKPNQVSIISSNVYQDNKNSSGCMSIISKYDPDLVLLLETDQFWFKGTEKLKEKYPHSVLVPLENTYGMLLYSKLELIDPQVRYLVDEDIPSIKTAVKLTSGQNIQLYCVHPTPPVPGENLYSTERDKELLLIAKEVKENPAPSIVVGDLNDVAWSYTTNLFTKISGMLDPRIGRGFYNTFHAKYPFLRFPLDHVFCSTDFKLVKMLRLENFSSDHFPIYISLQYEALADLQQKEPEPDSEEIAEAEEKINKETD